jgi:hypothetical protein
MSTFSSGLKFVGKEIASGFLGAIGSDFAGFVLSSIFGDSSNKEVMEALRQIGEQLKQIEYDVVGNAHSNHVSKTRHGKEEYRRTSRETKARSEVMPRCASR